MVDSFKNAYFVHELRGLKGGTAHAPEEDGEDPNDTICSNLYFYGTWMAVCLLRHQCIKLYLCKFIFPHIWDGCVHTPTHLCIKSYTICSNLYFYGIWMGVGILRHRCIKLYLCKFRFPHVWDGRVHTQTHLCIKSYTVCSNLYFYGIWMGVGILRHRCIKLYLCEFIFPRVWDGCVHTQTHLCIKLYLCEFRFPCVLDGHVHTQTHLCIKSYTVCSNLYFYGIWMGVCILRHRCIKLYFYGSQLANIPMCLRQLYT